jgi:tripartite-type tricarboxylate transporter receptor subunit TctC
MKHPRRQFLRLGLGAAALPALSRIARSQSYPSRPITIVVPFPAGGPSDTLVRTMAERMRGSLGQTIIIENVTGASGSIGVGRVARSAPDGYMLCIGNWPTHVINGAVYALPYHVLNDFEPVALIGTNPQLIVTKTLVPAKDLNELIVWLKAGSDKAYGTSGAGSAGHAAGVSFQKETGARFQFVPYRGSAPAIQDLVAGRIDVMIDLAANSLTQVRAGTIRAYAVAAKSRMVAAPEIATVDEAGLPGFYASTWHAFFAAKNTPKHIVAKINAAVVDSLADPQVRRRLTELGLEISAREQQTPEALGAHHKAEIEKWWPIIRAANIKAD